MGVALLFCVTLTIVSVACFGGGPNRQPSPVYPGPNVFIQPTRVYPMPSTNPSQPSPVPNPNSRQSQSILIPSIRPQAAPVQNNRPQTIPGAGISPPQQPSQSGIAPYTNTQQGLTSCKELNCSTRCRYGTEIVKDQNGCDECKCKRRPSCPADPACANTTTCAFGIKRINRCLSPTCECNSNVCPPLSCVAQNCTRGFAKDEIGFGCPTCECKRRTSSVTCRKLDCLSTLTCPSGSEIDESRGCPVCRCTTPVVCPELRCPGTPCIYGNVKVGACLTCECKQAPIGCPVLQCTRADCNGFVADNNGCPTCTCNAPSEVSSRRQSSRRQSSRRTSRRRSGTQ